MLYRCVYLATGGQTSVETESVRTLGITRSSHDDIKKAYRKKDMTHFGDESGMSGTLGRVEEFDGNKDDWQQYASSTSL